MYRKYLEMLKERNATTSDVCKAMDISESAMSMWKARWLEWEKTKEGREPTPSLETMSKLAKFFGVQIETFVGE